MATARQPDSADGAGRTSFALNGKFTQPTTPRTAVPFCISAKPTAKLAFEIKPFVPSMGSRTYVATDACAYPVLLRQIAIVLAAIKRIQNQSDVLLRAQNALHIGLHFLLRLSIIGSENR